FHSDEPLWGRSEDDRVMATPAVRITMLDIASRDQMPRIPKALDDGLVGLENVLSLRRRIVSGELSAIIDGGIGLEPIADADAVVVRPMSRGRMHGASARFQRDVIAQHDQGVPIEERVTNLLLVQLLGLEREQGLRRLLEARDLFDRLLETGGHDPDLR